MPSGTGGAAAAAATWRRGRDEARTGDPGGSLPRNCSGRSQDPADGLRAGTAARLGAYDGARLVECRAGSTRFPDACLLVLDIEVGLGQRRPVDDIRSVERVGFA